MKSPNDGLLYYIKTSKCCCAMILWRVGVGWDSATFFITYNFKFIAIFLKNINIDM